MVDLTSKASRTERVQVRLTEAESADLSKRGKTLSRTVSGLTKPDGSINLSAVLRHLAFKAGR